MSETPAEGVLQQIDSRLADLAAAQKQLKRPSTISFAERQSLSGQAAKAAGELRARRADVEAQGEPTEGAELPEPLKAALDEADRVLGKIDAAQPAGLKRGPGAAAAAKLPGASRRGSGGMSSQQRPPDRIGE